MFDKVDYMKTTTYYYYGGFLIDIQDRENTKEAWLYHHLYGVKTLIFGLEKPVTDKKILELLELQIKEAVNDYKNSYMD